MGNTNYEAIKFDVEDPGRKVMDGWDSGIAGTCAIEFIFEEQPFTRQYHKAFLMISNMINDISNSDD